MPTKLTHSMLGKHLSRRHFEISFFFFFFRKYALVLHTNCQFARSVKAYSFRKKIRQNITNLSSAELAQRVVKVKDKESGDTCTLNILQFVKRRKKKTKNSRQTFYPNFLQDWVYESDIIFPSVRP